VNRYFRYAVKCCCALQQEGNAQPFGCLASIVDGTDGLLEDGGRQTIESETVQGWKILGMAQITSNSQIRCQITFQVLLPEILVIEGGGMVGKRRSSLARLIPSSSCQR
jgi:hypothetical protein